MEIKADRDHLSLRVYINDLLHFEVRMSNHDGIQSWVEGSKGRIYFIEFYRKEGRPITLCYDKRETWEKIINLIDKNI